jgi:hypothetical protein
MTLRDDLLPALTAIRGNVRGSLGLDLYSVAIEVKEWSGAEIGEGVATTTSTAITEGGGHRPKARWLSSEEVAIGGYEDGSIEIGPITPSHAGGGTALTALLPTLTNGTARLLLTGPRYPTGVYCQVKRITHDTPFRIMITATPLAVEGS